LFSFFAATAPVVPFIPVFAKQLGYSASIVGTIYLVLPIVGMLAKPLFGLVADRFHRQKFLFLLFQFITAAAFISILLIPAIPSNAEFRCHEGENYLKFCPPNLDTINNCTKESVIHNPANTTFNCEMKCHKNDMWSTVCKSWNIPGICEDNERNVKIEAAIAHNKITMNDNCVDLLFHNGTIHGQNTSLYCPGNKTQTPIFSMNCEVKCDDQSVTEVLSGATDAQVKSTYQFWAFFSLLIISWAGMAVVVSVGDAICFEMLGDKPQRYGNQRLWGSIGWGTFSIISGLLIDKFSEGQVAKNYAIGFYLMGILILIDMIVSSKLKYSQTKMSSNIFRDVIEIMKSARVLVFFMWTIAVGLGTAMVWNFLFWHLEDLGDQYGCDFGMTMKTLQGLVSTTYS
jgi:MFS family permease